jgi:hypothetical protein
LKHALVAILVTVPLLGLLNRLVCHLPLLVREVFLNFKVEATHMLGQWLQNKVSLLCEDSVLGLLVVFDFDQFARILYLGLKPQQLFEGVIEEDDFFGSLMGQDVSDFLKPLWAFQERHQEYFNVVEGPHVSLFVLHLVLKRVLDKLELFLKSDHLRRIGVKIIARLRHWGVVLLGAKYVVWYFCSQCT